MGKRNKERRKPIFLVKTFERLIRSQITKDGKRRPMKFESGVMHSLQHVMEHKFIAYMKLVRNEMIIRGNKTLMMTHLRSVKSIRGEDFISKYR